MHLREGIQVGIRPVGRGEGVRGGSLEPPFGRPKDLYTCIYILSALPLESGPLVVSLLLIITIVQASLVAAM